MDDQEVFEIVDFTTASDWERFIAAIEEILNEWHMGEEHYGGSTTPPVNSDTASQFKEQFNTVKFGDLVLRVIHHVVVGDSPDDETPTEDEDGFPKYLQDGMVYKNDFPSRAHCLVRWFGIREFIVFSPAMPHQSRLSKSTRNSILSALSVSAANTNCRIPLFLMSINSQDKNYTGVAVANGSRTNFEMIHSNYAPTHCKHLSGLMDIFKTKLTNLPTSDQVMVSVRFTYIISEWSHSVWMQEPPDVGSTLSSVGFSEFGKLPFGVLSDPVRELQVSTTYPYMSDAAVVDSEAISDIDPLSAPKWSVRLIASPSPSCLLNEYLMDTMLLSKRGESLTKVLGSNVDLDIIEDPLEFISSTQIVHKQIPTDTLDLALDYLFPDEDDANSSNLYSSSYNQVPVWKPELCDSFQDHPLKNALQEMKSCAVDGFVWRLAILICQIGNSFGGYKGVAYFYWEVLVELSLRFQDGKTIPGLSEGPDPMSCLLQQKFQMLNNCIKKRADDDDYDNDEEFYECGEDVEASSEKENIKKSPKDYIEEAEGIFVWLITQTIGHIGEHLFPIILHAAFVRISEERLVYTLPLIKNEPTQQDDPLLITQLEDCAQKAAELSKQPFVASKYQTIVQLLCKVEEKIAKAQSLRLKFLEDSFSENPPPSASSDQPLEEPIEKLVHQLLQSTEVVLEGGPNGPCAVHIKKIFVRAKKVFEGSDSPIGDCASFRKGILGNPAGKEYILRCDVPHPAVYSKAFPQRLLAVILPNDYRMASAFTQDTLFC